MPTSTSDMPTVPEQVWAELADPEICYERVVVAKEVRGWADRREPDFATLSERGPS
jgi:hypothetical protein